jgi:sugar phosphate isomerase/epimerase
MELAFFADEVSKEDFDEAVRLGVEAGATGIELRGGIWGQRVQQIDDDTVKRVQDTVARHGVKILCVGSPVGKCPHDDEAQQAEHHRTFDRMIELAHAFDTTVIRGFALWNPRRKEDRTIRPGIQENLGTIVPFLTPIVERARDAGVTLSLENESATMVGSCREAREVADALEASTGGTDGFSFCWDVNNGIGCDEPHMPDGYEQIKGRITHLHVKPNPEKEIEPIRGSEMPYADLLKQLLDDGYTGPASIEHWGSPELMLKGVRQLRQVLDSL